MEKLFFEMVTEEDKKNILDEETKNKALEILKVSYHSKK
jgi:hypothetical protein